MDALVHEVRSIGITSIALPPLGCGNGGLDWEVVRPIIENRLSVLDGVLIEIYGPSELQGVPEYSDIVPKMTRPRAIYLKALASMEQRFGGGVDRLSMQKIAYLLQCLGVPFNLEFKDGLYGPYSETLKKALVKMSHWGYLSGLLGGDRRACVTAAGYAAADDFMKGCNDGERAVVTLGRLVQGYDSPYGLELLATAHMYAAEGLGELEKISGEDDGFASEYRKNSFSSEEIAAAINRLIEDGLLNRSALGKV